MPFGNLINLGEAVIRIKADDELFVRQVQRLAGTFMNLESEVTPALNKIGVAMKLIGLGAAGVGAVMATVAGSAVVVAGRMTSKWNDLQKSIKMSTHDLAKMREEVYKLAQRTADLDLAGAIGLTGAVAGMGVGYGMDPSKRVEMVADFADEIARLAPLVDMPIEQFASKVLYLQKTMGLAKDDTTAFASALAGLAKSANVTQGEILAATEELAPSFQALGASVQDLMAFATDVTESGVGSHAITRLLSGMLDDVRSFAMNVKLPVEDFAHMLETRPIEAVKTWIKAFDSLPRRAKFFLARDLGIDHLRMSSMIRGSTPGRGGIVSNEWDNQTSAMQALNLQSSTFGAKLERIYDSTVSIADVVGRAILPAMTAVAEWTAKWAEYFRENQAVVEAFFQGLGQGFVNIAQFASDAWEAAYDSAQAVMAAIWLMIEDTGTILSSIWRNGGDVVRTWGDLVHATIKYVVLELGWLADVVGTAFLNVGIAIKDAFVGVFKYLYTVVSGFVKYLYDTISVDLGSNLSAAVGEAIAHPLDPTRFFTALGKSGQRDLSKVFGDASKAGDFGNRFNFKSMPSFDSWVGDQGAEIAKAAGEATDVWGRIGGEIAKGFVKNEADIVGKWNASRWNPRGQGGFDGKAFADAFAEEVELMEFSAALEEAMASGGRGRRRGRRGRGGGAGGGLGILEMSILQGSGGFNFGSAVSFDQLHSSSPSAGMNPLVAAMGEDKDATKVNTDAVRENTAAMQRGLPIRFK